MGVLFVYDSMHKIKQRVLDLSKKINIEELGRNTKK